MNPILEAALSYASLGWHVFPIKQNSKEPVTENGLHAATTDENQIRRWFPDGHTYNLAINAGASGLAVIDIDIAKGDGKSNWENWCKEHEISSNGTTRQFTPSGGYHLVFKGKCRNSVSKLAPHVDSRGVGGYIVVAPSTINGVPYYWDADSNPENADFPGIIEEALRYEPPEKKTLHQATAPKGSLVELVQADVVLEKKGTLDEYCGQCPWCGGHDRFIVGWEGEGRDGGMRYYCRQCERMGDSISWRIDRKGESFPSAAKAQGVTLPPLPATFPPYSERTNAPPLPQDTPVPLTNEETSCSWVENFQRIQIPMIFEDVLPLGIVGSINAEGGTGKTFFMIAMFVCASTGLPWGPFKPTRPQKCLLLLAEDPQDVLKNRIFDTVNELVPASHRELFKENFHFAALRGKAGPLLQLENGNPSPTKWAKWVEDSIAAHPGVTMVGVDPLRKFLGLEENKNEFAHAFVALLEEISERLTVTNLFVHHIAKAARASEVKQISSRGASGFGDDCRWIMNMREVDPMTFATLELNGQPSEYIETIFQKNSYAPKSTNSLFYRRGEHGIFSPIVTIDIRRVHADYLIELLRDVEIGKRELLDRTTGKEIRDAMKERFKGMNKLKLDLALEYAIELGLLTEVTQEGYRGHHKPVLKLGAFGAF